MDQGRIGPLPHFLGEDVVGVLLGVAGVDDQRQLRSRARRRCGSGSCRAAGRGRYGRNNNRARSPRSRSPWGAPPLATRVAVSTSGCTSASCGWIPTDAMTSVSRSAVAITASHSEARVEMLSILRNAGGAGAGEHPLLILDQAFVIEMAVAIDEHGGPVASASLPRHPCGRPFSIRSWAAPQPIR